jgi:hypothetical protein
MTPHKHKLSELYIRPHFKIMVARANLAERDPFCRKSEILFVGDEECIARACLIILRQIRASQ